jgi:C-terminal peptidase prc
LSLQINVFQDLWETVRDEYLYRDFNGLDWDAIHTEFKEIIRSGLSNDDFYQAMEEMIFRLGDEHSAFYSPEQVIRESAEFQGTYDFVGIGILVSAIPERNRGVIIAVFPDSPAEQAGLKPRDSILSVEGTPILDENGFLRSTIRGPEGTQVTIIVQTPGGEARPLTITRQRINSILPVNYEVITSASGKRIGYIFLVTFADSTVDESVAEALRQMTEAGPLDGLIIDNRSNNGGADTVVRPILSYLTKGTLGYWVNPKEEHPMSVPRPQDINGSQNVPLVVLVGEGTASFGEIFAGVLQDTGRAYVIGETTGGNVETLWGYDFEDGSRAWIAHESFRPLNQPEVNWEETGIIPNQEVLANWDEYTLETDPVILAAVEYLSTP